jgi:hypothetical protein
VVYHLLSVSKNYRLRVKAFVDEAQPMIETVTGIWAAVPISIIKEQHAVRSLNFQFGILIISGIFYLKLKLCHCLFER